jgi:hypothetical protein
MHIITNSQKFSEIDHWRFLHAANLSEFYFPEQEFKGLIAISNQALAAKAAYGMFEMCRDVQDPEAASAMRQALTEGGHLLRMFAEVDAGLRIHLRLMPPSVSLQPDNLSS